MKNFRFLALILLNVLFSCEKDRNRDKATDNKELVITIGTVCGWCAGADSLSITKDKINYVYITPWDDDDYSKKSITNESEWNELVALLDITNFQNINLNTCNVCVDGCDTWISVKNDSITHKIRYGYQDSIAIKEIKPFVNKLNSIRSKFNNK